MIKAHFDTNGNHSIKELREKHGWSIPMCISYFNNTHAHKFLDEARYMDYGQRLDAYEKMLRILIDEMFDQGPPPELPDE